MVTRLLETISSGFSAPVAWKPNGGNANGERCLGSLVIAAGRQLGLVSDDVTSDGFPTGNDMRQGFQQVFPHVAAADPDMLKGMMEAIIRHNDGSASEPLRMSKAWTCLRNLIGREVNLCKAARAERWFRHDDGAHTPAAEETTWSPESEAARYADAELACV